MTRRTLLASIGGVAWAARRDDLLSLPFPKEKLASLLTPRDTFQPYPAAANRGAWEGLDAPLRQQLIEAGAEKLAAPWPSLPATVFLEYKREGNRSRYERIRSDRRQRLADLVLAECAEHKGRFLDAILNGLWLTCEESFWGVPAHLNAQVAGHGLPDVEEPIVDLFAAETASMLAWIDYLLAPNLQKLSPLVRRRIHHEVDRRLLTPCRVRNDFGWMGLGNRRRSLNNWTPWIDSNWLACALLLEKDPARRVEAVSRILRSLDQFLIGYADDGGCDEGPGYWSRAGGSLFDCLELVHLATKGQADLFNIPLVQEIGRYIPRAHVAGEWYVNFADASAKASPSGDLVYRYGRRINDASLAAFGAWIAQSKPRRVSDSLGRELPAIFGARELARAKAEEALLQDAWMPGIQVMTARQQAGTRNGFYLAAQGGHNAESHNHNDVGNFIVYLDGNPLLIDIGVETYSAKTFSSKRYDIWTMQSAWHNCPTIGTVMQQAGREFEAKEVQYRAGDTTEFSLNLAGAYPAEAGLTSWRRTLRLNRQQQEIQIAEAYQLSKAAPITLTLMSAVPIVASGKAIRFAGAQPAELTFDAPLTPRIEEVALQDGRLRSSWGDKIYRLQLTAANAPNAGTWNLRLRRARS